MGPCAGNRYVGNMLGYTLAAIIGILLLGLCLACLGGGARARAPDDRRRGNTSEPAADEPTPDRSTTASNREINTSRQHTPPA
jgi:hypothetical protein